MRHVLPSVGLYLAMLFGSYPTVAEEAGGPTRKKSVTVYPVAIRSAERTVDSMPVRIAEVVSVLLERAGMEKTEIAESVFSLPETDDVSKSAAAFGQFIKGQPLKTKYALLVQIVGTGKSGIAEIHTIVVDKHGKVSLAEVADRESF